MSHNPSTTPVLELLRSLPSVNLQTLNATAELLNRRDRKYLVPTAVLEEVLLEVGTTAAVLSVAGRYQTRYHTTYFDTADWLSYRLSATKRRRRFKIRLRAYESDTRYLEVKTNGSRGRTQKNRWLLPNNCAICDVFDAATGLAEPVQRCLDERNITSPPLEYFHTVLQVQYNRSTLLLGSSRATIDSNLKLGKPGYPLVSVVDSTITAPVIVETKTLGATTVLDRALWARGFRPIALSKFAAGVAHIYGFPGNRWHRLLTKLQ
ncbi:MAG: VTC domain-containing protein [Propionibacteriaceae bacterium]|jgi:hypothetical protein|nr:VTC domain-containing protein [Propionibacteriaceae bacterium]